jgi:hypothetical protein
VQMGGSASCVYLTTATFLRLVFCFILFLYTVAAKHEHTATKYNNVKANPFSVSQPNDFRDGRVYS